MVSSVSAAKQCGADGGGGDQLMCLDCLKSTLTDLCLDGNGFAAGKSLLNLGSVQKLRITRDRKFTDGCLQNVQGLTQLVHMNLERTGISATGGLCHLHQLGSLESLCLTFCEIGSSYYDARPNGEEEQQSYSDAFRLFFASSACRSLKNLTMMYCGLCDGDLESIPSAVSSSTKNLRSLESLRLGGNPLITNKGISFLKDLTSLRTLKLEQLGKVTDISCLFEKMMKLEELDLSSCSSLSSSSFEFFSSLPMVNGDEKLLNLTALNLDKCVSLDDEALLHLSKNLGLRKNLRDLSISDIPQLTNECLVHLAEFECLVNVSMGFSNKFTAPAVKKFKKKMKSLNSEF